MLLYAWHENEHEQHDETMLWATTLDGGSSLVTFLLAGNLSPLGMRLLDYLNVEPPLSDITLAIVLFAISGIIYCLICPKRRKMI